MTSVAPSVTYEQFLALETNSAEKHEYLNGQIIDMAGGTVLHGALAMAIGSMLHSGLRNKPCRVLSSDVRIRGEATNFSAYPDVSVACGEILPSLVDQHAVTNPRLVVEVLSEATEAYDRGEKFAHYRRMESLKEYLLVSQTTRHLELFRLEASGHWTLTEAYPGEKLEVCGVEIDVDELYRDPMQA